MAPFPFTGKTQTSLKSKGKQDRGIPSLKHKEVSLKLFFLIYLPPKASILSANFFYF